MSDDVADVLARVERLEAERSIIATLYRYGSALDYGNREQFLECFTTDAKYVVTLRSLDTPVLDLHGAAELASYFDGHTHAPVAWHKHVTTNEHVALDGNRASVLSYFIRVDPNVDESGPATVHASGRYIDDFVHDGDCWRIHSRLCEVENL